jgi:hypothetical protein
MQFTVQTGKRVNTREECQWSHAWQRFKRSKVKLNGTHRVWISAEKRAPDAQIVNNDVIVIAAEHLEWQSLRLGWPGLRLG